jgi:DNA-binding NarL/FixJ family response regulator
VSATVPLRVVVADDEPLIQRGIVTVLEETGFEVVAVVGDADDLLRKTSAHKPDVVISDIQMPPGREDDGLRAAQQIRSAQPQVGVLILSQYLEAAYALELVGDRAEGVGYLLKQRVSDLALFAEAVRRVALGGLALDPDVVARMVARPRDEGPLARLTPREREVLALMAEGRSNAAIAARLVVTEKAIEKHVSGIFDKLGLRREPDDHRRVLAVLRYLEH